MNPSLLSETTARPSIFLTTKSQDKLPCYVAICDQFTQNNYDKNVRIHQLAFHNLAICTGPYCEGAVATIIRSAYS